MANPFSISFFPFYSRLAPQYCALSVNNSNELWHHDIGANKWCLPIPALNILCFSLSLSSFLNDRSLCQPLYNILWVTLKLSAHNNQFIYVKPFSRYLKMTKPTEKITHQMGSREIVRGIMFIHALGAFLLFVSECINVTRLLYEIFFRHLNIKFYFADKFA